MFQDYGKENKERIKENTVYNANSSEEAQFLTQMNDDITTKGFLGFFGGFASGEIVMRFLGKKDPVAMKKFGLFGRVGLPLSFGALCGIGWVYVTMSKHLTTLINEDPELVPLAASVEKEFGDYKRISEDRSTSMM
eukprot:TRINITY_DN5478_c0_g1_i2.p1 TRINITY_DN5478_c0_g1~~TRINITY_DN5478_c0_g1_i2.p1  ORF type:complete len:136 (+),score=34.69 TRINITY_DN5478_c0_g1_i2:53-460(+)